MKSVSLVALGVAACTSPSNVTEQNAQISGAIFTTTADGSRVNANIYTAKEDVYLDGGPGPNAPAKAAGLPEGDYYFQVTNPNGRILLSSDDISCRSFHVNDAGVIDLVYRGDSDCVHQTGIDQDHAADGAITIQLMPYADTPNPGGVYKVWVTPVGDYDPDQTRTHGFVPSDTKTDNFKVVRVVQPPPPPPPACGDGTVDAGEQCDDGNTTDGDGCSANCTTELPPPPPPPCGNGVVDEGEQCDDGNTVSGDGCSATCQCEPS